MKKILKSIGAVLGGFVTVFILSVLTDVILEKLGIFPPQTQPEKYTSLMLLFALIYRGAYTVIGGYITAKLAPSKPMKHAIILATIGTIVAILGTIANWNLGNHWYPVALVIISPFCILLGAKLNQ